VNRHFKFFWKVLSQPIRQDIFKPLC